MNIRLFIFLAIVLILVALAVMFELKRDDPWDSDVFFSELNHLPNMESSNETTNV
ncbi:hypothetical protein [Reinekea sp.]|jgi:hypothetical protein|uniref:hypothetical protein n=1 Tax=Reinekea sp. TaxID=1970455 RepID=UPI0039890CC6